MAWHGGADAELREHVVEKVTAAEHVDVGPPGQVHIARAGQRGSGRWKHHVVTVPVEAVETHVTRGRDIERIKPRTAALHLAAVPAEGEAREPRSVMGRPDGDDAGAAALRPKAAQPGSCGQPAHAVGHDQRWQAGRPFQPLKGRVDGLGVGVD
jgi:hypothetical protein